VAQGLPFIPTMWLALPNLWPSEPVLFMSLATEGGRKAGP
jgi:hypothetical protein